jgi:hypothetical protein
LSMCAARGHGKADSGISIGARPALDVTAGAAGAATAGAAGAGVAAGADAGRRPVNGEPAGIKEARPVGNEDSRFCGAAAAGAALAAGMPGNAVGGCGRVTDAVAAGAGVVAAAAGAADWAPPSSDVKPCMSCVAAAGLEASCWRNGRPGTLGAGAGAAAGSAAAVALSPSATGIAPAAAITLVASIFLVNFMVLPIR